MARKVTLSDIKYGQMNNLSDPSRRSFDARRTSTVGAIQSSNVKYFTADVTKGKRRWDAIILRSIHSSHPYAASEFQKLFASFEEKESGKWKTDYWVYKIWITEPMAYQGPPPTWPPTNKDWNEADSIDLAKLNMCKTAIAPLGQNWGQQSPGTPCQIMFENQENIRVPLVVDVRGGSSLMLSNKSGPRKKSIGKVKSTISKKNPCDRSPPDKRFDVGRKKGFGNAKYGSDESARALYDALIAEFRAQGITTASSPYLRELVIGVVLNAKQESGFAFNNAGDVWKPEKHPNSPGFFIKRGSRIGCYKSFGMFQNYYPTGRAKGYLKYFNAWDNGKGTEKALLTLINGEKQVKYIVYWIKSRGVIGKATDKDTMSRGAKRVFRKWGLTPFSRGNTIYDYHEWFIEDYERSAIHHRKSRKLGLTGEAVATGPSGCERCTTPAGARTHNLSNALREHLINYAGL